MMDRLICGVFRRGETGSNEALLAREDLCDPPSRLIFHEQDGSRRPFSCLVPGTPRDYDGSVIRRNSQVIVLENH